MAKSKRTFANCIIGAFLSFEDWKEFCEQINRVDLIYYKTVPTVSFDELKEKMLVCDKMEEFYE